MTAGPTLSPEERIALDEFKRRVQRRYGPRFVELRLFGSRASRKHRPESDADVAVVLKGPLPDKWDIIWDLAEDTFDLLVQTGIDIQPTPVAERELLDTDIAPASPLVTTIAQQGIRL